MNWKSTDLFNPLEEHSMLRDTVRNFAQQEVEPQALKHDKEETFNLALFRKLGDLGLLGITVPEEFGGSGMDATAAVIVHEELASSDPGFCLAYLAHSMLCVNNIAVNASKEQKEKYLEKLCTGEWVGAMAMSEPGAGTDVLGMSTVAEKDGDNFKINGRKMWITNGCIDEQNTPCNCLLLYARTSKDTAARTQISTFIIEDAFSGFSVGQKITEKAGMRASNTAELCFDNCIVPAANLIGAEGDSMLHMMKNLEVERLTLAAMSLGIARRCLQVMTNYANEREAFGSKLSEFGQIQKYIGESYAEYQAARAYVYNTARKLDINSHGQRLDSDGVKLFAAKIAKDIADRSIQVLGGYGYVGEYNVERLWRDSKLLEIGGGTIEAHQKNITRDLIKSL
ncbi:MAG: acyl-CoA dehydrogenase family protein [Deltaproteobacteria bacterium]|nr:acyl-CoA dehydrogenase family protein [Deltaproteobacteria bacterium]